MRPYITLAEALQRYGQEITPNKETPGRFSSFKTGDHAAVEEKGR